MGLTDLFDFLAFRADTSVPGSIVQCIAKARENARTIRDYISREMWEDINGLFHSVARFEAAEEISAGPHRFCNAVRFGSHRFHGVTDATLPHDDGWQFLRVGCFLERAEMTARLVDVQYQNLLVTPAGVGTPENHQWMAVLRSVGAYEDLPSPVSFASIEPERVAEMLILHPLHPRSIRFSMTEVQAALRAVSGTNPGSYANEAERLTGKVLEGLRYDKIDEIFKRGLHAYLHELLRLSLLIGEDIARTYFFFTRHGDVGMNRYHLVHVTRRLISTTVPFRRATTKSSAAAHAADEGQSCLSFRLTTTPAAQVSSHRDALGNWVHQFNVLAEHRHLTIETESVVLAHNGRGQQVASSSDAGRARFAPR